MKPSNLVCPVAVLCLTLGCSNESGKSNATPTDAAADGAVHPEDYFSWAVVERFTRDGVTKSGGSLLAFHKDRNTDEPRMERIDDHCLFHTPIRWDLTGHLPPSFGSLMLRGPGDHQLGCEQQPNFYVCGNGFPDPPWGAGDTMRMTATGADLPGFDLSNVVPEVPTLTSKNLATLAQFEWTIHLAEPLALTWAPMSGEVQAMIIQLSGEGQQQGALRCVFPGMDGAATIPAETLAHLPTGGDATEANFYFFGINREDETIDGLEIELMNLNGLAVRVVID